MEKKVSKSQGLAIKHGDGPCIVLSGPGSGKTFVLTNRVLNLISEYEVNPENILVITFTRAAANEMKSRFLKLIKDNQISLNEIPTFGTFHSIFFEILKNDFGYNSQSLLSENEERFIISQVLEEDKKMKVTNDTITNIIKDIKNYKLYQEREERFIPRYLSISQFTKIYDSYQEKLFNYKKLDFSDMISKCEELLSLHRDVLKIYQEKYKYILVDEFQDINKSQYDLVKMICKNKNLFVVGDDDQSIYRFRGSHPRVMNDFIKDFRNAKKIYLTENYRSARKIVKFSKQVINNNRERFDKDLSAHRTDVGKLEIKAFVDSLEENKYIIQLINKYQREGISFSDMAVLYRTNLLANSIRSELSKNNIAFRIKGEDKSIYDSFAVKDIIAYLKYAINDKDVESLVRISNKPLRYISRDSMSFNGTSIDDLINFYSNKDYVLKNLYKLKSDIKVIATSLTPLAIRYIRTNVGYDKYLIEYCRKNDIDFEETLDLLDAFEDESVGYNKISDFIKHIEERNDKVIAEDEDAVNLMTFHLSKGLEFKVVFIIDSNDGLIPHKKSIRENDLETERRLFYVAMTRAKDNLHIFFTVRRFGKNFKASRFITEALGGQNG